VNVQASATKAVVAGPASPRFTRVLGREGVRRRRRLGERTRTARPPRAARRHGADADRIELVSVGAGQVACVASTGEKSVELLWAVQSATPASTMIAKR
jgi:hypothetical protein